MKLYVALDAVFMLVLISHLVLCVAEPRSRPSRPFRGMGRNKTPLTAM